MGCTKPTSPFARWAEVTHCVMAATPYRSHSLKDGYLGGPDSFEKFRMVGL